MNNTNQNSNRVKIFDPSKFDSETICDTEKAVESAVVNDDLRVYLSVDYGQIDYTLEINGIGAFPKGDLQAIKAKAKQGKTHLILCFMIALLRGAFLNMKSKIEKPKICYFATEEHKRSVQLLAKKVHRLCGLDTNSLNEQFLVYALRKQNPKERALYIEEKIKSEKPDIVFIDGIRDLVSDFNNIDESNKIIGLLMKLSEEYNCSMVNVIHTNKSYSDSNMRGHLGTELLNKCSDVLEVEKKGDVFNVEETDCRNIATGKWAFNLDDSGLPQKAEIETPQSKTEQRIENMKNHFTKALSNGKILTFTELRDTYMLISGVKIDAANKHVSEMTKEMFLTKTTDEKYKLA